MKNTDALLHGVSTGWVGKQLSNTPTKCADLGHAEVEGCLSTSVSESCYARVLPLEQLRDLVAKLRT